MSNDDPFTQVALATRTLVELPFQRAIEAAPSPERPGREGHLSWMLARAIRFFENGSQEKAYLWLGFVQGALAMRGIPLCELDVANRAEGAVGSYALAPGASEPPDTRRASMVALAELLGLAKPSTPQARRLLEMVLDEKISFVEAWRRDEEAQAEAAAPDSSTP